MKMRNASKTAETLKEYLYNEFIPFIKSKNVEPEEVKLLIFQWVTDFKRNLSVTESTALSREDILKSTNIYDLIDRFMVFVGLTSHSRLNEGRYEIDKAIQLIENNLHSTLTLEDISEKVGLSPNYFSYIFKKKMGESIKDYIIRLRMERAANLLRNSNLKVYEIAEQIGIPNYRYFSSVFQEYY